MKPATRLYAQASRFLRPGSPTGLTGLLTHSSPRSTLLYTYSSTLDKLKKFPESSVYRQSTEALTKHRLSIIESVKPEGLDAWQERVRKTVEGHPEAFRTIGSQSSSKDINFIYKDHALAGLGSEEWDDEPVTKPEPEGPRTIAERATQGEVFSRDIRVENAKIPRIEPEPPLSADQIIKVESEIGAGLIEEIIQIAEGESALVDTMMQAKVWEDLEVKPTEGQWAYYERDRHTPVTQAR